MHSTTTPLPWEIALAGIIIAGFARAMRKKDPEN
jgi:hypothetical protein